MAEQFFFPSEANLNLQRNPEVFLIEMAREPQNFQGFCTTLFKYP